MGLRITLRRLESVREQLARPGLDPWRREELRLEAERLNELAMSQADDPHDRDLPPGPRCLIPAPRWPLEGDERRRRARERGSM